MVHGINDGTEDRLGRSERQALALGAVALGAAALAIGAVAIGRLKILNVRVDRLSIGTLTVDGREVRSRTRSAGVTGPRFRLDRELRRHFGRSALSVEPIGFAATGSWEGSVPSTR